MPQPARSASKKVTLGQIAGAFALADQLRAMVEQEGQDAPRFLYAAFAEFNAAYFDGQLPPAAILLLAPSSPRALGDHIPVDEHGIKYRVRIAPACVRKGALFLRDVLLHELVHVAQAHLDGDNEPGYRGHGPKFAARCNAIGALLGLPEVAARGARKGLPDCAQWPVNVRPPGYYGVEVPPAKRRAAGGEASDEGDAGDLHAPKAQTVRALEEAMRSALECLEAEDVDGAAEVLRAALNDG